MGQLPAVNRLMDLPGGPDTIGLACSILGLPDVTTWPHPGIVPWAATVLDVEGRDITKLYEIVFADDSTPQFPDGKPGVLALRVDDDGEPCMYGHGGDRVAVFPWPGIKIVGTR